MTRIKEFFTRSEKAMLMAAAYLASLVVAIVVMAWIVFVGGNPFTVSNLQVVNSNGQAQTMFKAGDVVGIRRILCATERVQVQYFPTLKSDLGMAFPLPSGMSYPRIGCNSYTYGFILPAVPPGAYFVSSTVQYQVNLVGRDEYVSTPPIYIEVR